MMYNFLKILPKRNFSNIFCDKVTWYFLHCNLIHYCTNGTNKTVALAVKNILLLFMCQQFLRFEVSYDKQIQAHKHSHEHTLIHPPWRLVGFDLELIKMTKIMKDKIWCEKICLIICRIVWNTFNLLTS